MEHAVPCRGGKMKFIRPHNVLDLVPRCAVPCVSIYANSPSELGATLEEARQLLAGDIGPEPARRLLRPLQRFRQAGRPAFPLALFAADGFSGFTSLPFRTKAICVVARSFHVKPLLKWMQREQPFALLLLEAPEARLFQGTISTLEELESLPYREMAESGGTCSALDRAVHRSVRSSRTPLILAGDVDLMASFREFSSYRAIVEQGIADPSVTGNRSSLHQAAVGILEPFLERREEELLSQYRSAERAGRASAQLKEIIQMAVEQKVKHLFVNERMNVWGEIDYSTGTFTYSARQLGSGDDDLLDDLAELVLRNGGAVTVISSDMMPGAKAACAILQGRHSDTRFLQTGADLPGLNLVG
jgi:hypothetical protein